MTDPTASNEGSIAAGSPSSAQLPEHLAPGQAELANQDLVPTDAGLKEAQRRAAEIISEATTSAERSRAEAREEADRIREEARQQARTMLSEMGAQLADMGEAYREAIREARNTVNLMAEGIQGAHQIGSNSR